MEERTTKPQNIDEYIALQKAEVQPLLKKIRETIVKSAPEAIEIISYGMPAFKIYGKILAYFAANKNHIGFYATPTANLAFVDDLENYKTSKGAVQFPYNKPIPYDLIEKMIQYKANKLLLATQKRKQ